MDTSPAVSGANVNAIIHKNYQGGDIVLPNDKTQVITVAQNPDLKNLIGDDIITADGTTLLGSDDKSGIAEIMTMIDTLHQNPEIKHGNIAIAFTPDEEVGAGIEKFDVEGLGPKFAYTVDGDGLGDISTRRGPLERRPSRSPARIRIRERRRVSGQLDVRACRLCVASADRHAAGDDRGARGFVHPGRGSIEVERSTLVVDLRDFEIAGLEAQERLLRDIAAQTRSRIRTSGSRSPWRSGIGT